MSESHQELLRKIKALADSGTGGEKENARRILQRLLDKYGILEDELESDTLSAQPFSYSNPTERTLLIQVCYKVTNGTREVYTYKKGPGSQSQVFCNCTKAEGLRISFEYEFYRLLWKDEEEMMFRAFVQKHRIFSDGPAEDKPLPPEELKRLLSMMSTLQDKTPTPLIGSD